MKFDYDDIIASSSSDEETSNSAVSTSRRDTAKLRITPSAPPHRYIEITLNYPRTATFLKYGSFEQKRMYTRLWNVIINNFTTLMRVNSSRAVFEYCRSGQVHLHGYLVIEPNTKYYVAGLVSDMVKCYLNELPKKYNKFVEKCIYYFDDDNTVCYKCPSIKICHRTSQLDRFTEWEEYLSKQQ